MSERASKADATRQARTEWGEPFEVSYGPESLAGFDPAVELGEPGEYPFTRGIYPTMYRGRLWTMRQYSGYGSAEDTNARYKYLMQNGQTGLSVAFDLPSQIGLDSDDPQARAEVGVVGVAVDTLKDFELMFEGIPLDKITTSFTINAPSSVILAMYAAVGEKQGVPLDRIGGTLQNEPLKDILARGTYIYPVDASMRLVTDVIEWCGQHMPKMNPISICSVHIQQAGAHVVHELAIMFVNAIAYVEHARARNLDIDQFAPQISFNLAGRINFFQEICKVRAARRIWARLMKERWHAKDPRSWRMRVFGGICGSPMHPQEPYNNIVRATIGAVHSALSGLQAVHVTPWDEPWAIPTEESTRLSLRIQQIVAYETDIAATVDPLAGSYFVESMTNQIEKRVLEIMEDVESRFGNAIEAINAGYLQRLILDDAYDEYRQVQAGEKVLVAVNRFQTADAKAEEPPLHQYDPGLLDSQLARLKQVKAERDAAEVDAALSALRAACAGKENVMPPVLRAVKAYATIGEICGVMKEVFGEYQESVDYV